MGRDSRCLRVRHQQAGCSARRAFPTITAALAAADDAPAPSGIDPTAADALTRAAPIYRKAWWPVHRAANRAWQASIETLVVRHGTAVRDLLATWYRLPWPSEDYAVHVSAYSVAVGVYSSTKGVLVVSSVDPTGHCLNRLKIISPRRSTWPCRSIFRTR